MKIELRYSHHPADVRNYDTARLRKEFVIERLFTPGEICLTYSLYERFIIGGAMPGSGHLELMPSEELKTPYFLNRREIGIFNIGGKGRVKAGDKVFELDHKEALYLGCGDYNPVFESPDPAKAALFYFNSVPAHRSYPDQKITLDKADTTELGNAKYSNLRRLRKMIAGNLAETCQLQMGMTEVSEGSVWNTMPVHTHHRRSEVYLYFGLPENQVICHLMGEPEQTRHMWLSDRQAVISPPWSIHSAAGTTNYCFIWGMAGENKDFSDMDNVEQKNLR